MNSQKRPDCHNKLLHAYHYEISCHIPHQLPSLKSVAHVDPSKEEQNKVAFDDSTIQAMKEYFHVQDRDVLLKYLRDTMVSAAERR
jgi:hypothetical protein